MLVCFFRAYFGSTWAAIIGLTVFLLCWGNPWYWSNVYALKHLPVLGSYPSIHVLWLTALLWTLCLPGHGDRHGLFSRLRPFLIGTLTFVIVLSHMLTAAMALFGAGLLILLRRDLPWRRRSMWLLPIGVGALLTMLWPYYNVIELFIWGTTGGIADGTGIADTPISVNEVNGIAGSVDGATEVDEIESEPENGPVHPFYRPLSIVIALGPALAGVLLIVWLVAQRRHWFITLGACSFACVYVVNMFHPLPMGHRYLLYLVVFLHLAIIAVLVDAATSASCHNGAARRVRALCMTAVAIGIILGIGNTTAALINDVRRSKHSVANTFRALAAHLSDEDVVMGKGDTVWPLPAFGGRVVDVSHPNPLITDLQVRLFDVLEFFDSDTTLWRRMRLIEKHNVTHILVKKREYADKVSLSEFLSAFTREVERVRKYRLFEVIPAPRSTSLDDTPAGK